MNHRSFVVLIVSIAGTAASPAAAVSCGETLTPSVTLTADLDCPEVGLFIGADDVTVSLAGHTISGPGSFYGIAAFGVDRVTLLGPGSVVDFETGVSLEGGSGHLVRGLTIRGLLNGLTVSGGVDGLFLGNRFAVGGVWIRGAGARGNRVLYNHVETQHNGIGIDEGSSNTIAGNLVTAQSGVALHGAIKNTVRDNTLFASVRGVWITGYPEASPVVGSRANRVVRNRVFDASESGVLLDWNGSGVLNRNNRVIGNVVRGGERGVWVREPSRATRVEDNVLFDQTVAHIEDAGVDTSIAGNVCWPGTC